MGYQALLFCPDEKTARGVSQVLSELDFAVTPCTEPFAAVKKLMAEHFDAVVVDCDNEQNATLLFKSARNTVGNQSSLAVAVVEGQAGVAKAFRIGANLVLTKPINVEQAKGTLRVARGLLRKSEAAKPAIVAASAKSTSPSSPSQEAAMSHLEVAPPAEASPVPAAPIANAASAQSAFAVTSPPAQPKAETAPSRTGFGNAASAPAPARDPQSISSISEKTSAVLPQVEIIAIAPEHEKSTAPTADNSGPAPTFTFGGTVGGNESTGGGKKALLVAAAVVVLAVTAFAAWMHWGRPSHSPDVSDSVTEAPVKTPAAIPQAAPSPAPVTKSSAPDTQPKSSAEKAPDHAVKSAATPDSAKPSPSAVAVNQPPMTKEADAQPLVIKNGISKPARKSAVTNDAPAPPSMTIATGGSNGGLPNLMDSAGSAPTPVLQTLSVSQGVSQGLLVKKVPPKYPQNALRLRVEGAVQLMATISKTGDISVVKILEGDSQLAHAAVDAVKQWKYKPYLLNGEPVEIQTQITVNFKLPK